ncbi:MAG: LD-carboxypeptidase, partial [Desulfamplus sp.]|nr:LD-carboxypeptidase [Desulfamplus sp.]
MVISNYTQPPSLKQGDTIGICAPSGIFDISRFNIGINMLKSMGFNLHIPDEIYQKKRYMAGEDKLRADVINSLFQNSNIKGIVCARGGFGALRTLDYIDYDLITANPKLFVGFSDVTALLMAISERSRIQVVHGPVVTSLADANEATVKSLYQQLTSYCSSCDADVNSHIYYDKVFGGI